MVLDAILDVPADVINVADQNTENDQNLGWAGGAAGFVNDVVPGTPAAASPDVTGPVTALGQTAEVGLGLNVIPGGATGPPSGRTTAAAEAPTPDALRQAAERVRGRTAASGGLSPLILIGAVVAGIVLLGGD